MQAVAIGPWPASPFLMSSMGRLDWSVQPPCQSRLRGQIRQSDIIDEQLARTTLLVGDWITHEDRQIDDPLQVDAGQTELPQADAPSLAGARPVMSPILWCLPSSLYA